ncbi:uncharacterized protein LOC100142597 isoform X1 [Tribolium castaneum]|uniref:Transcription initiation factor TFIID subunit 6 n=1 Tax=Tribolium castaneum TaxID=7070 RepID=A0A139WD29_TRICA|nr:PREDICTED: uncharacterized protein LOC100142597 isoform X1 [Tribolium castaneum]KYB25878.1 hypothetical protein TcasGA2_TC030897 [Tribolium castaneum]|eukprot:XP_001809288.1 PREDICTED: uncharacterized protein LOC100142597 isoform X1 [Tribolium castaneum]
MKPSNPTNKASSSAQKAKKSSKDREKRKSQGGSNSNHVGPEKGSPTKDANARLYAGIDSDSIINYAEQTAVEHLSEDITNTLAEDINYRLRYIINDCLIKARLCGRNAISSSDLEQTFDNLRIDRVYGAPSHPNWLAFSDQSLLCLEDKEVNLLDLAHEQDTYYQYYEPVITTSWLPEQKELSKALKNYFSTMCQMVVSSDIEIRKMVLTNIGENPRIGPIIEWFYNFGYILLSKDITYDCLTLRALDLIRVLENSPMCRIHVSEKQLKLLVRLILQRLLKSTTTSEVLKPMCSVLAILSQRGPLREFIILKIFQKLDEVFDNFALPVITAVNSLGIDAIQSIVLPNLNLFLARVVEKQDLAFNYSILESYNILYKEHLIDSFIYDPFVELFADSMVLFNRTINTCGNGLKKDLNFAHVKCDLLKTRRKISPHTKLQIEASIEEVFDLPPENSKVRKKMQEMKWDGGSGECFVIIGKTSLLLPVFAPRQRTYEQCVDHSLWYSL